MDTGRVTGDCDDSPACSTLEASEMLSDIETWGRLWAILEKEDYQQTIYCYRANEMGDPIGPYLFRSGPYRDLVEDIQAEFGAGEYRLLIRKGKTMVFSGRIHIGPFP